MPRTEAYNSGFQEEIVKNTKQSRLTPPIMKNRLEKTQEAKASYTHASDLL